jgi:hypothetical protein
MWIGNRYKIASSMWEKKIFRGPRVCNFKIYYKVSIIKTMWQRLKNRHKDQWTEQDFPGILPHKYDQLIFDKGAKTVQCSKNN